MTTHPDEIIVTGSALGSTDTIDALIAAALVHVRRSRTEEGCVSHAVYRDVEDTNRLFFFERWASREALNAHFAVPDSNTFVAELNALTVEPPTMRLDRVPSKP